jgi:hypothetical protein
MPGPDLQATAFMTLVWHAPCRSHRSDLAQSPGAPSFDVAGRRRSAGGLVPSSKQHVRLIRYGQNSVQVDLGRRYAVPSGAPVRNSPPALAALRSDTSPPVR